MSVAIATRETQDVHFQNASDTRWFDAKTLINPTTATTGLFGRKVSDIHFDDEQWGDIVLGIRERVDSVATRETQDVHFHGAIDTRWFDAKKFIN